MDTTTTTVDEAAAATANQLMSWIGGLSHEVDFWDEWFRSDGGRWSAEFQERLRESRDAPEYLQRVLARTERSPVAILDVGSGPLTQVGAFRWPRPVEVRAVDPLAQVYSAFIRREKLNPPIWPEIGFAEDLSAFFAPESFDVLHCCNALDHSFDPLRGIGEMIKLLRVGGTVVLLHAINEAVNANYVGLHQWNFDLRDGRAMLWNRERQHDLAALLAPACTVSAEPFDEPGANPGVLIYIHKQQPLDIAPAAADAAKDARIRVLLTAMIDVALRIQGTIAPQRPFHRALKKFLLSNAPAVLTAYRGLKGAVFRA